MLKINSADLQKVFDELLPQESIDSHGRFQLKQLVIHVIDNDEVKLVSEIEDDTETFTQTIILSKNIRNSISVSAACNCTSETVCSHSLFSCQQYTQFQSGRNKKPSGEYEDVINIAESETKKQSEFVVYILSYDIKIHSVYLSCKVTRWLASDELALGKFIRPAQFSDKYLLPSYATTQDLEIAKLIGKSIPIEAQDIALKDGQGSAIINKIIETKRSYLKNETKEALSLGERRPVDLSWEPVTNDNMKLLLTVQPEAEIIQTVPALYLDNNNHMIGPLQGASFTPYHWDLFNQMPLVPAKDVAMVNKELVKTIPQAQVTIENKTKNLKIIEKPIPRLQLLKKLIDKKNSVNYAVLRFGYGSYEVPALPRENLTSLILENQVVSIKRDIVTEKQAVQTLEKYGLVNSVADSGGDIEFFSPVLENRIEMATFWKDFMESILPKLENDGWDIKYDIGFEMTFHHVDDWRVEISDANEWFDLRFDLEVGNKKIPFFPLISEIILSYEIDEMPENLVVPISENEFVTIPSERVKPVCEILYELFDRQSVNKEGVLRLNRFDANRVVDLEEKLDNPFYWRDSKELRTLGKKLQNFSGIEDVPVPSTLTTSLRDYQHHGLNWMQFLRRFNFGGILADDMGLGKTIQTLANLLTEKENNRLNGPCLVIAPTSLMSNWRRESEKFSASLRVLILQGSDRHSKFESIEDYDLVLSTYPLIVRDREQFLKYQFYYMILDEAQMIKNSRSKVSRVVREIHANHKLCLSGTPMENHLGELWAQFDFLMPGLLGNEQFFKRQFRTPIEKHKNIARRKQLIQRVSPFMLRRRKVDVVTELPSKTEMIRTIALGGKQAALYESIRLAMEQKVRHAISQRGLAQSRIMVLDALLKLRQTCCDPSLLSLANAADVDESAKLDVLMEMLHELLDEGRKILVFSQFTKMLAIIENRLNNDGIRYAKLTGQTRQRDAEIEKFKNGSVDVFLVSLKAGGVGLNLTEADTVIHYDPWWNPAAENQATDRAHRIGQDKAVFVFKLIAENTVEEKILALQEKKQSLVQTIYDHDSNGNWDIDAETLEKLFEPLS